jgi:hypothetical protein
MIIGLNWIMELLMGSQEPPKKRNRSTAAERSTRPSLRDRIVRRAKVLEEKARKLPAGAERDAVLLSIRDMNLSDEIVAWLSSPGLQPPK